MNIYGAPFIDFLEDPIINSLDDPRTPTIRWHLALYSTSKY